MSRRLGLALVGLLLVLVLGQAPPAHADGNPAAEADLLLNTLSGETDATRRFAIADQAIDLCQKAIVAHPRDPRPHLALARALTVGDLQHPEACRPGACQRAVEELKRARSLDTGGVEAERIASDLGIVLSRLGAFAEALAEYDRALGLVESERRPTILDDGGDRAILYGNSAETLMALGRLSEAIDRYRLAEAASSTGDDEWQLAEWGLAVAFDRDEQVEKSRAAVARALELDPNMSRLSIDGVFFEPAGDKHYYEALGREVAGDRNEAVLAWREYLSAQPSAPWTRRARAHLEALKKTPRGDAPTESLVEVAFEEPMVVHGVRTPQELSVTVAAHLDDVRLCYSRSLRAHHPPLAGARIKIAIDIMPPGFPMRHVYAVDADSQIDAELVRCVERVASNWRFSTVTREELDGVILPFTLGRRP